MNNICISWSEYTYSLATLNDVKEYCSNGDCSYLWEIDVC